MKWEPKDIIALVALLGCIFLMALGYNHFITYIFAVIISVYVGIDITIRGRKKNGKPTKSEWSD